MVSLQFSGKPCFGCSKLSFCGETDSGKAKKWDFDAHIIADIIWGNRKVRILGYICKLSRWVTGKG
jgi:hypothetical protein